MRKFKEGDMLYLHKKIQGDRVVDISDVSFWPEVGTYMRVHTVRALGYLWLEGFYKIRGEEIEMIEVHESAFMHSEDVPPKFFLPESTDEYFKLVQNHTNSVSNERTLVLKGPLLISNFELDKKYRVIEVDEKENVCTPPKVSIPPLTQESIAFMKTTLEDQGPENIWKGDWKTESNDNFIFDLLKRCARNGFDKFEYEGTINNKHVQIKFEQIEEESKNAST